MRIPKNSNYGLGFFPPAYEIEDGILLIFFFIIYDLIILELNFFRDLGQIDNYVKNMISNFFMAIPSLNEQGVFERPPFIHNPNWRSSELYNHHNQPFYNYFPLSDSHEKESNKETFDL